MNVLKLVVPAALLILAACKSEPAAPAQPEIAAPAPAAAAAPAAPAKAEIAAAAPAVAAVDCNTFVDKMASFQSSPVGAAEKKLFGKMCESITAEQRACVVGAKNMDEGKNCLAKK